MTDLVISKHGQKTRTTSEPVPSSPDIHSLVYQRRTQITFLRREEIILAPKVPVKPKQLFDYFLVLDIEATCDSPYNVDPPEIIEFPVLKVNAQTFETESIFHSYVRPVLNPELTNFCIELTGIIQGMVNAEPEFKEVYQNFLQWLEKEHILKPGVKFAFVTCSDPDLNYFFPLQCRVSGIEVPAYMKKWICVKRSFTDIHPYTWPDNISKMLEYCELKSEGDLHSGIEMAARKRLEFDSVYIPDDLSDSESDFSFESDSDLNFSNCSSSSDESDHDSINLQSVRQWCKIDMKNIPPPPPPVLFRGNPGITVNIANNASEGTVYNPKYSQYPVSTKTVLHLLDRFLGKGYCVTIDNFYMSPQLADILVTEKTDTYGTVNKTRKDLPVNFSKEKVPKGEIVAYQRGKVMALKWQDKKSVCLMSTIHNASSYLVTCKSKKTVMKPVVICDYNNTMVGVDLCDQEMSYYPTLRKQQGKYYIKIFRQFLGQLLWNAYVLYKKQNPTHNIKLLEFRL
ncbi:ERI1 exoribonuclease 3 [Trichonephila clavipes]|nr:ERI1 exoribonuclease 3 [Trichonephila clavipes]